MINALQRIPKLADTIAVPVFENGEPMVKLNRRKFMIEVRKPDMLPLTGHDIFVRKTVSKKLEQASVRLNERFPGAKLLITYGYRSPEIQRKYFLARLLEVGQRYPKISESRKRELAHQMSASPDSAGHTCGAAVDLSIWDARRGREWDMGSNIAEFGRKARTESRYVTPSQRRRRRILQKLMMQQEFAPFLAEWWHFSYGDKEWAFYYNKTNAIYGVIASRKLRV